MITVKTESTLPNGLVRRRYEVTLTDLLGDAHTDVLGMFNHSPEDNGSSVEADYLQSKKEQEIESYKEDVRRGVNPFSGKQGNWNTRAELLKPILDDALSLPATDILVMNGLQYMQYITDEDLMFLYGKDQLWVDAVRVATTTLLESKTTVDNYQPLLEL
tara:strand:- start:1507 stop:1986 length:480 start_codon:yes stop_codon:yes gene_type:complete